MAQRSIPTLFFVVIIIFVAERLVIRSTLQRLISA